MPSLKSAGGALGAIGSVKNFINVVKEVDFEEVRRRAELAPMIVMLSGDEEDARSAAGRLFGERPERFVEVRAAGDPVQLDAHRYDIIVVHDPAQSGLLERVRSAVGSDNVAKVFFLATHLPGDLVPEDQTRATIVAAQPELAPSLGRFFPLFRAVAAKAIMEETSRANAQFALVSNVPAVIPVLGNLIAASADLVVLTKNQIMMCYKLAALNGRDLHNQTGLITELAPVVGAGFLWRTAAREASAMLPFAAGTIPKVVIAYAGTLAIGWSADFYFKYGKKPSRAQVNEFVDRATKIAKALPIASRKESSADFHTEALPRGGEQDPTEPLPPGTGTGS
ncbi:MAG TPA: hypothetical protein VNZ55_10635 [Thermomicrobiales bacterium]|nr:hypothetical protein [Thermomicrobiales bacterium]